MSTPVATPETLSSSDEVLPDGWELCESKSQPGKQYYFNRRSGQALWTRPTLDSAKAATTSKQQPSPKKNLHPYEYSRKTVKRKTDCPSKTNTGNCKRQRQSHEGAQVKSPVRFNSTSSTLSKIQRETHNNSRKSNDIEQPVIEAIPRKDHVNSPNIDNTDRKVHPKPQNTKDSLSLLNHTEQGTVGTQSSGQTEASYSPSQFFEANKRICSLQDHLAEVRNLEKEKRKDTFAAIEDGITNQTIEYSSKNHPATPPHFRQVSQIVSSMKSRLNENIAISEKKPKFSTPANDRLNALRASLTPNSVKPVQTRVADHRPVLFENKSNATPKELTSEHDPPRRQQGMTYRQVSEEGMEVEQEVRERNGPSSCNVRESELCAAADRKAVLVLDTNIFIHDLKIIKLIVDSYIVGYKNRPSVIVPWQVINELDKMKDNNNGNTNLSSRARVATDYLYEILPNNERIKGQTLREANNHIYPCELPDDEILNCCLQQAQNGNDVILISNDKNLCNRATINSIRAVGIKEISEILRTENQHSHETDSIDKMKYYEDCIYQLLAHILESEMRAKYDNLWQHVVLKAPPWSLLEVLQCLLKHWIAVFSSVFPIRLEQVIQQLKTVLLRIHDKGPHSTEQDVEHFKELSYELASKCQIIPDYMELAKRTMDRLRSNQGSFQRTPSPPDCEKSVINAFEIIWTALSSFCAKFASMLGVPHQLEDNRADSFESEDKLRDKWPDYSSTIQSVTYALKRTLTANENSSIEPLYNTLSECLIMIDENDVALDRNTLRTFCLNNRNMIHAALVKFTHLSELLSQCQTIYK